MSNPSSAKEVRKAFTVGSICIISYFLSYYMRNILSVVTPYMLEENSFDATTVALFSSVYCIVYAVGQLVNGTLGDLVKPKYMVLCGYTLGGAAMLCFPLTGIRILQILCFGVLGFGFSMLRGPLVKTISENTLPRHARVCCVFFSFSCSFGPLVASILSMIFAWKILYTVSAVVAFVSAAAGFLILTVLEKRGTVKPVRKKAGEHRRFADLFKVFTIDGFVMYLLIAVIVEIASTSISFWIPTYVSEELLFSKETASMIFSVMTLVRSVCPFLTLFLFILMKENDTLLMRIMFCVSVASFAGMFFVGAKNVWVTLVLFLAAQMAVAFVSSVLWSIYIPSLAKSGRVSGANGILDCSGYVGASLANIAFAALMESVSWSGLILVWGGIMACGIVITFFAKQKKTDESLPEEAGAEEK